MTTTTTVMATTTTIATTTPTMTGTDEPDGLDAALPTNSTICSIKQQTGKSNLT